MNDVNVSNEESSEERSKDECYDKVAAIANTMIELHGKDFAMGTLVLAARFIAEGKPLSKLEASH